MALNRMLVGKVLMVALLIAAGEAKPEIPSKGKHTRNQDVQQTSLEDADMPRFAEPIANVTVSVGRDALLACVVENLKGYKVAWVRVDTQTILSIHHNVISQNNRISLTYNDHRSWYLHIKEVEENDRGWYMCQVNTDPMRSRKGYLQVVVPPVIVESLTSNDMVVREGLNVTLQCKARGYPEPYVMWRREDGEEMLIGGEHVNVVDGEFLHITKVSRLHMAAYLCVASNGVPPSISKRVHLKVQFPPMLSIPNQLEGAYVGQDVMLECHTEAYPASINYWTTERGDMIISDTSRAGDKYETTSTISGYTKYMKLKIRSVGPNDFGTYRCVAKNSLGETDGNIKLDEMPAPTTAIMSEMAMLNRSLDGKRRHRNKFDMNALPDYGVEEWRDGAGNSLGNGIHGPHGSSLNSAGFNGHGGNGDGGGDNNQTPVRNPPGAFHNAAGSLAATHNLVGTIIQRIKMQSLGIFERLSSYVRPAGRTKPDEDNDEEEREVNEGKRQTPPVGSNDGWTTPGGLGHGSNATKLKKSPPEAVVVGRRFFLPAARWWHGPLTEATHSRLLWPLLFVELLVPLVICIMLFTHVKLATIVELGRAALARSHQPNGKEVPRCANIDGKAEVHGSPGRGDDEGDGLRKDDDGDGLRKDNDGDVSKKDERQQDNQTERRLDANYVVRRCLRKHAATKSMPLVVVSANEHNGNDDEEEKEEAPSLRLLTRPKRANTQSSLRRAGWAASPWSPWTVTATAGATPTIDGATTTTEATTTTIEPKTSTIEAETTTFEATTTTTEAATANIEATTTTIEVTNTIGATTTTIEAATTTIGTTTTTVEATTTAIEATTSPKATTTSPKTTTTSPKITTTSPKATTASPKASTTSPNTTTTTLAATITQPLSPQPKNPPPDDDDHVAPFAAMKAAWREDKRNASVKIPPTTTTATIKGPTFTASSSSAQKSKSKSRSQALR